MKYLFKVLIVLLVFLFGLKFVIFFFDSGHVVSYSVGNFKVKETLKTDSLYGMDDYYFEVVHEDFDFNFQLPLNYNKKEAIITNIEYEENGDWKCVLPVFKGSDVYTDVMCLSDSDVIYFYHDLNENDRLKFSDFVDSLSKYEYNLNDYIDDADEVKLSNSLSLYESNVVDNHYLAVENYKGLSLVNGNVSSVKIFDNDVYKKDVKIFGDKYYIVADYNEDYSFKIFYVVNIINGNVEKIRSYDDISFDSVAQGFYFDDVYIFDKDALAQYKVSLKYETVEKVAGKDDIKYYNGEWSTMSLNDAIDGKKFDSYYADVPKGYDGASCIGDEVGFCYSYKKVDDGYFVYRFDVQNSDVKTFLFRTSDVDSIIYLNDYIYFKDGNVIYYYGDKGVRKVLLNKEFEFNDDIGFGAYIK